MESKLKTTALQVAGWGLLHGDFFDFHAVTERLGIPAEVAREAVIYLRSIYYVDTLAESRSCKREVGKRSSKRVFIKVLAIHSEPPPRVEKVPPEPKWEPVQQQLAGLVKLMPIPRRR